MLYSIFNLVLNGCSLRAGAVAALIVSACTSGLLAQSLDAPESKLAKPGSVFTEKPASIAGLDVVEKLGTKIPLDIPLLDSTGKPAKLGDWFNQGRPVLVLFVFHRCPLACPQLLEQYSKAFRDVPSLTIGRDFNVVVVSIDPTDKPEVAAAEKEKWLLNYGRTPAKEIAAGWAFLTSPDPSASRKVADAVGYQYRFIAKSNDYAHPSVGFVLTSEGMVSRYLYGISVPAQTLRLALVEAGEGKIGSTADRFILWCFHYDPSSGAYTFAAWRLMQIGGFISVILVAGLLLRMLVHEWRRRFSEPVAVASGMKIDNRGGDAESVR